VVKEPDSWSPARKHIGSARGINANPEGRLKGPFRRYSQDHKVQVRLFTPSGRLYERSKHLIFREIEDLDLIAKTRRGDVEAYNVLVSRWEKRVFNYLLRLVSNREDALDVSQETFLKAYQNLRKLDDPARFSAWLFRIAHNEAFSLLRRRKPEAELAGEPRPRNTGGRLLPVELSLAVESALMRLNEDQREAVLLKVYQGFKFEEMAEILECPVSTVKSRLYTALDLLKTTLAPTVLRGES
jgi:RNA polymerase sigma-70 factor (ECF subfamily)